MNASLLPLTRAQRRDLLETTSLFGGVPLTRREAMRRCVYGSAGLLLMEPFGVGAQEAAP